MKNALVALLMERNKMQCLYNRIQILASEYEAQMRKVQSLCSHKEVVETPSIANVFGDMPKRRLCIVCLFEEEEYRGTFLHLNSTSVRVEENRDVFFSLRAPHQLRATVTIR